MCRCDDELSDGDGKVASRGRGGMLSSQVDIIDVKLQERSKREKGNLSSLHTTEICRLLWTCKCWTKGIFRFWCAGPPSLRVFCVSEGALTNAELLCGM